MNGCPEDFKWQGLLCGYRHFANLPFYDTLTAAKAGSDRHTVILIGMLIVP